MTREQFIQTVKCEQRGLRRFLLTLCRGDRMTADDIAQETLVKAYLVLDKYDERSKAKVWLMKIAYNTFLNHRIQATRYHYENIEEVDSLRGEDAADSTFRFQQLEQAMARRQGHLVNLSGIPGAYHHPAGIRIVPDHVDDLGKLVDGPSVRSRPGTPLMAVDRTKVSVFVGPFVPDGDPVVLEVLDVGVTADEPEELVDDGLKVYLLGGQ